MEMGASDYDLKLEDLIRESTVRLLTGNFKRSAFDALKRHICEKAELIKDEHVVSKQVLSGLRGAAHAIRNQGPYVKGADEASDLADEFEMLLDLIIAGEGCNDRQPGVPRII